MSPWETKLSQEFPRRLEKSRTNHSCIVKKAIHVGDRGCAGLLKNVNIAVPAPRSRVASESNLSATSPPGKEECWKTRRISHGRAVCASAIRSTHQSSSAGGEQPTLRLERGAPSCCAQCPAPHWPAVGRFQAATCWKSPRVWCSEHEGSHRLPKAPSLRAFPVGPSPGPGHQQPRICRLSL